MRVVVMGSVIYGTFLLQTTVLRYTAIFGVTPLLTLLVVITYAVLRGDVEGAVVGFCAGILQDIFFMEFLGLHAVLFAVTGYFSGKPFKDFFTDSYLLPVFLSFIAMIGYGGIFYFRSFVMAGRFLDYLRIIILPETIYTVLLAVPVYRLMFALNKRIEKFEKRQKKIF